MVRPPRFERGTLWLAPANPAVSRGEPAACRAARSERRAPRPLRGRRRSDRRL